MSSIEIYNYDAQRTGNEAVAVTASTTPGGVIYGYGDEGSVLHNALVEATNVLEITVDFHGGAVVFEGNIDTIDRNREENLKQLATKIANYVLNSPYWESSTVPKPLTLAAMVSDFGQPAGNGSFGDRIASSLERFIDPVTEGGLSVYRYATFYPAYRLPISEGDNQSTH